MSAYISIKLFATLRKFLPQQAEAYPLAPGTTVAQLIETLGIPVDQAKLIFVNGVKGTLATPLKGGERVGIFPPVGGG